MEQDGDRLIASHLGPRCEPICSERQVAKVIAAEGFCEVRHPRQTRRTEQPKGGETVRASEVTRAWFRPPQQSHIIARPRQPTALPSAGGCGKYKCMDIVYPLNSSRMVHGIINVRVTQSLFLSKKYHIAFPARFYKLKDYTISHIEEILKICRASPQIDLLLGFRPISTIKALTWLKASLQANIPSRFLIASAILSCGRISYFSKLTISFLIKLCSYSLSN